MARLFDRDMFIMLLTIMIGVVIITYFIADIQARSQEKEKYTKEISIIESKNLNFTSRFLSSIGDLDRGRKYITSGNYYFDMALIWYNNALIESNISKMYYYVNSTITYCEDAIVNFNYSMYNFKVASVKFQDTLSYSIEDYFKLVDLYVNLSDSGDRLSSLRLNASYYLKYLAENITIKNGTISFDNNVTDIQDLFNSTLDEYNSEMEIYDELEGKIEKEYNIIGFSEDRTEIILEP